MFSYPRLVFALLLALVAGCAMESSPATSRPEQVRPDRPPTAAAAWQPTRLRQWPLLDAWLAGGQVDITSQGRPDMPSDQLAARGKALFDMYCWQCHGAEGRGDGPRSPLFTPAPRDLTRGTFKFRSTPSGQLPTRADLFRTISGGLRGTGMMPFADLPEQQRWAIVEYVRTLSPRFASEAETTPVSIPTPPPDLDTPERATRGQQAFAELGCVQCHGVAGRGDGPAAADLRDGWGRSIRPTDLAAQRFKRSDRPAELYRTLATGLDGTPMPAFGDSATADSLWDAVAFVRALGADLDGPDERAIEEADKVLAWQHRQGRHTVEGGCGCQARRGGS